MFAEYNFTPKVFFVVLKVNALPCNDLFLSLRVRIPLHMGGILHVMVHSLPQRIV
mgnify:CR=1 FL=1